MPTSDGRSRSIHSIVLPPLGQSLLEKTQRHSSANVDRGDAQLGDVADISHLVIEEEHIPIFNARVFAESAEETRSDLDAGKQPRYRSQNTPIGNTQSARSSHSIRAKRSLENARSVPAKVGNLASRIDFPIVEVPVPVEEFY